MVLRKIEKEEEERESIREREKEKCERYSRREKKLEKIQVQRYLDPSKS